MALMVVSTVTIVVVPTSKYQKKETWKGRERGKKKIKTKKGGGGL